MGGGGYPVSQGAGAKCTSLKKAWARREGLFGNFSCHFRVAFWEGGVLGKSPAFSEKPVGGDPDLHHPRQWRVSVLGKLFRSSPTCIHSRNRYLLRTYYVLDVILGSGGYRKHTENSLPAWN